MDATKNGKSHRTPLENWDLVVRLKIREKRNTGLEEMSREWTNLRELSTWCGEVPCSMHPAPNTGCNRVVQKPRCCPKVKCEANQWSMLGTRLLPSVCPGTFPSRSQSSNCSRVFGLNYAILSTPFTLSHHPRESWRRLEHS